MVHNGTGYVGLGWRPGRGIDGRCRVQAPGNYPLGMLVSVCVCVHMRVSE